jgi:hypothetical protein
MILRESRRGRPRVIDWWIALCFLSAALTLLCVPFLDDLMALDPDIDLERPEDREAMEITTMIMIPILVISSLVMLAGPFLPRGRVAWIYGIIQLALSMLCGGCLCLLPAIPILVFWLRPDCRDWFCSSMSTDVEGVFE